MNENKVIDSPILNFKVQIVPKMEPAFINWQVNLHEALASTEGFLSLEIIAISFQEKKWRVTLRFNAAANCLLWQGSESHTTLMNSLKPLLKDKRIELIKGASDSEAPFDTKVTEVFVTELQPAKEKEFRTWAAKVHGWEAKFPGFCGVYIQAPSRLESQTRHWITFLQFDSQENLDRWLNSNERQKLLQEADHLFASIENHRVVSSYPGWFHAFTATGKQIPPLWKQAMLILLVLFPIVMVELNFLNPHTADLNPSLAMFLGNVISVGLVTWPLMPFAIKLMGWWLRPLNSKLSHWITFSGLCLLIIIYAIEVWIFW